MNNSFRFVVDNKGSNTVETVLKNALRPGKWNSIATAYFTVSGFQLVADEIEKTQGFRLLIGSEPGIDPMKMLKTDVWRNMDVRGSTKDTRRVVSFFSREDVKVRLHIGTFLHAKAYILNHREPQFARLMAEPPSSNSENDDSNSPDSRARPVSLLYKGPKINKADFIVSLVGSSNFTDGGLRRNSELNLLDYQAQSATELLTWFQEKWEDSREVKTEFLELLQGYYHPFDPFLIYAKALWDFYKDDLQIGPELGKPGSNIELATFQFAGYQTAKRILERWNAVLIADAPGLGKTFIAGRLMEDYAYHRREPTLIICPAEVEDIWRKFCQVHNVGSPTFLHTEMLGRGMKAGAPQIPVEDYKNFSFILVDESHHFRNPDAGRYIWLQQLLATRAPQVRIQSKTLELERKVVFVTATPVNNSVWDLYAQLRLLLGSQLPDVAARQGIRNVMEYFKSAEEGSGNLYDLIEAIGVRRSRSAIRKYFPEASIEGVKISFPERKLDRIDYSMNPKLTNLHDLAVRAIQGCTLVPYRTAQYKIGFQDETKTRHGDTLSDLFRIVLLKRLESSLVAFRQTIKNILDLMERSLRELRTGRVFTSENLREYRAMLETAKEDQENNAEVIGRDLAEEGEFDIARMIQDLENDTQRLSRILEILPEDKHELALIDNKLITLIDHLKKDKKKILIFCSFIDTANYLFENLKSLGRVVGIVTGDDSKIWYGSEESGCDRSKIISNFSPRSNRYHLRTNEREIEVLIATDVLSEAINLQDAGVVLNYDFPWNPMKLVQRTGRIDRIGSNFKVVSIYNIFSGDSLENLLHLMRTLSDKIAESHRSVGLEWSLLGEEPFNVDFADLYNRLKKLDSKIINEQESKMEGIVGLDPQEQLLAILQNLSREKLEAIPDGAGSLTQRPPGIRGRKTGLFIAYRRKIGDEVDKIWRFYPDDKLEPVSNKTEIAEQIQYGPEHRPELRFGDESLERLKSARLTLEEDLQKIEAQQRTERISGPVRKAFQLVQARGTPELDRFLQTNWEEPAVQRAIRRINFKNEEDAIQALLDLARKLGKEKEEKKTQEVGQETKTESEPSIKEREIIGRELPPLPEGFDPNLELVCWMHII